MPGETETRELLNEFEYDNPGVVTRENIKDIIAYLKNREMDDPER